MDKDWLERVYTFIGAMEVGADFDIRVNVASERVEAFTELCKLALASPLKLKEFVFSEDMNVFKRVR